MLPFPETASFFSALFRANNATLTNKSKKKGPSTKPKTISSSSSTIATPPWTDLPSDLTMQILESLPLSDYIRFASVCQKWRWIQKDHRGLHSPNPPPMLESFPWLIKNLNLVEKKLQCYSLSDSKFIHFDLPNIALQNHSFSISKGWIFMVSELRQVSLLNPLANIHMQLPPIDASTWYMCGGLSSSPLDPNCIALIINPISKHFYLCRVGQKQSTWTSISYSDNQQQNTQQHNGYPPNYNIGLMGVFYCKDKFYCFGRGSLWVLSSASNNPSIQMLNMDCSEMVDGFQFHYLMEFRGDLINVTAIYNDETFVPVEFHVFMADFCGSKWRKMYDTVNLVFFISEKGSFCLFASDVGCKGNCLYYMGGLGACHPCNTQRVFDMDLKQWSDGPPIYGDEWLLPSLDFVDHA